MGAFRKTIPTEVSWIGLGVFLLPTLVLSMLARRQLAASIRKTSALLLGVAVYFAYMLLGKFLNLRFTYPEVGEQRASHNDAGRIRYCPRGMCGALAPAGYRLRFHPARTARPGVPEAAGAPDYAEVEQIVPPSPL